MPLSCHVCREVAGWSSQFWQEWNIRHEGFSMQYHLWYCPYPQRLQKLIYLHLLTGGFMKNSLQSSEQNLGCFIVHINGTLSPLPVQNVKVFAFCLFRRITCRGFQFRQQWDMGHEGFVIRHSISDPLPTPAQYQCPCRRRIIVRHPAHRWGDRPWRHDSVFRRWRRR